MANYVITYDIDNASNRKEFVDEFEEILKVLGLDKKSSNQSTYFGSGEHDPGKFINKLRTLVQDLDWEKEDELTIYHPEELKNNDKYCHDIGEFQLKSKGNRMMRLF